VNVPTRYAFEQGSSSDEVIVHKATETYPGTDAETKCSEGKIRQYIALGASAWPAGFDLVDSYFPGMRARRCAICFKPERYSSIVVSLNGVILMEEPEVDFAKRVKR
jgi:hypothetical protein